MEGLVTIPGDFFAGDLAGVCCVVVASAAAAKSGIQRIKGVRSGTSTMYQIFLAESHRAPKAFTASFSANGVTKLILMATIIPTGICSEAGSNYATKQKAHHKDGLFTSKPWSGKRGSNSRPIPWQGIALPTELFPHFSLSNFSHDKRDFQNLLVAWGGIEPPTQGFSILCSTD
jgi:hypothetical protein